jgi:hypothetical protein
MQTAEGRCELRDTRKRKAISPAGRGDTAGPHGGSTPRAARLNLAAGGAEGGPHPQKELRERRSVASLRSWRRARSSGDIQRPPATAGPTSMLTSLSSGHAGRGDASSSPSRSGSGCQARATWGCGCAAAVAALAEAALPYWGLGAACGRRRGAGREEEGADAGVALAAGCGRARAPALAAGEGEEEGMPLRSVAAPAGPDARRAAEGGVLPAPPPAPSRSQPTTTGSTGKVSRGGALRRRRCGGGGDGFQAPASEVEPCGSTGWGSVTGPS